MSHGIFSSLLAEHHPEVEAKTQGETGAPDPFARVADSPQLVRHEEQTVLMLPGTQALLLDEARAQADHEALRVTAPGNESLAEALEQEFLANLAKELGASEGTADNPLLLAPAVAPDEPAEPSAPAELLPPPLPALLPSLGGELSQSGSYPPVSVEVDLAQLGIAPTADLSGDEPSPESAPTKSAKVVVFFGCRGGAGATTLAVNLANTCARADKDVLLLDLDLQLGDAFVAVDMEPQVSLGGVARDAALLDGPGLRRRLQRHFSGFYALTQVGHIDEFSQDLVSKLPELFQLVTREFDVVIVDGVRDFNDHTLPALDVATEVVLVVSQDVLSVRRANRVLELCRKLRYPESKLRLVVNRGRRGAGVRTRDIERALGLKLVERIRDDFRAVQRAQDSGVLLSDRSAAVGKELRRMADRLVLGELAPKRRRGFFGLGKRRGEG